MHADSEQAIQAFERYLTGPANDRPGILRQMHHPDSWIELDDGMRLSSVEALHSTYQLLKNLGDKGFSLLEMENEIRKLYQYVLFEELHPYQDGVVWLRSEDDGSEKPYTIDASRALAEAAKYAIDQAKDTVQQILETCYLDDYEYRSIHEE